MNNTSLNIAINSLSDFYKAYDIIVKILLKLKYSNVSISGKVKDGGYSLGKDFNDIAQLKLSLRCNSNINFDLSITGQMYNNFVGNYISVIIIRNSSYGNRFNVACTSDNPDDLLNFVEAVEKEYMEINAPTAPSKTEKPQLKSDYKKHDVFVSHATADKVSFVNKLVMELQGVTPDVWYDRNMIKWGNNIKAKIYAGLEKCEFGIVVFSKSFIGRVWTEEELSKLLLKQDKSQQDVILPILLNDLPEDEFKERYPELKDILFIKQSDCDVKDIAIMFAQRLVERLKEQRDS